MAVKRSLWSLTLLPGERTPLFVQRDFVITNAALGEELRNETGRSIVKVTHQPIPASLFDDESESDEDDDEDVESEEEFELDVEEGFKLTPKKGKANGVAAVEEDDEEEEDEDDEEEDDEELDGELDDEDSEDDSDFSGSEDGLETTNVLCSLLAGRVEQATLNLTFCEGDVVVFEVTGENSVHLMGNYVIQPDPDLSDYDSEYDSELDSAYDGPDDFDELYGEEDDEDEDMDDEPEATIEEIVEKIVEKPAKKLVAKEDKPKAKAAVAVPESKKRKAEEIESPAPKAAAAATPAVSTEGLSKSQKKKLAKKAKVEGSAPAPAAPAAAPAANGAAKKTTLPSGLIIEDVKVGDGPVAKPGKRLGMRYIGKLENGKQFDSNTAGKPFMFTLNRGEVIKGWDQGIAGMAVGGERRLTIPAALAYGSQKLPGIPKNSTLKFDIKLVSVN